MMRGQLCVLLLALRVGALPLADVPSDELARGEAGSDFRRPSAYRSRAQDRPSTEGRGRSRSPRMFEDRHPLAEGRGRGPRIFEGRPPSSEGRGPRMFAPPNGPPPPRYPKPPAEWVATGHHVSSAGTSAGMFSRSAPPPPPRPPPVYPAEFVGNYSGRPRVAFGQFPKVTQLVGPKMHKTGSTTFGAILARLTNQCDRGGLLVPEGSRTDGYPSRPTQVRPRVEALWICRCSESQHLGDHHGFRAPANRAEGRPSAQHLFRAHRRILLVCVQAIVDGMPVFIVTALSSARWGSSREKKLGPFADGRRPYTFSQLFNFLQLKVPRAQFVLTVREVKS